MSCSICSEDFVSANRSDLLDEGCCRLQSCTHVFHTACLLQWCFLENKNSCPLCRSIITGCNHSLNFNNPLLMLQQHSSFDLAQLLLIAQQRESRRNVEAQIQLDAQFAQSLSRTLNVMNNRVGQNGRRAFPNRIVSFNRHYRVMEPLTIQPRVRVFRA